MAKIAVVHVPFYSHVGALTRLTAVLSKQGHELVAWGPEPARDSIEAAGARFEPHQPEMPGVAGWEGFVAQMAQFTEQRIGEMVEALHPHDFDLLIHDSQVPWARVAGDYLGLPRIISHPMFPIVSPERIAVPEEEDERLRPDPGRAKTQLEASWLSIARTWGVELGEWHRIVHSTAETTFTYTIEEILGEWKFEDAGWVCVGPLMEALPREPPPERPLVYVCFGTSFNRRPEQFRVVIEALADEPVDVLMSGGMGPITEAELEPLPPNFTFEEFVPNREALARASVHITHGGCNSTHEALLAGVPMVFLPQAYDQFPLAGAISALGAGRWAEEDAGDMREAVRWSLLDPLATARAKDLGERLATFDGEQRVANAVERVLARSQETAT